MQFKSVTDLNDDVFCWLASIPRDVDLVVGIPRSGMLPATLLALHLHTPLASVTDYINGRTMHSGQRLGSHPRLSLDDPGVTVLVVDDSVYRGQQMKETRRRIQARPIKNRVLYGATYVAPGAEHFVDLYYKVVPVPRVFEWHLMNHEILSRACVDIDGVLCRNPTDGENDDGTAYEKFLHTVDPLLLPRKPIMCLITNRHEKYRSVTEEWLQRHGIMYERLIMMDTTMEARRKDNQHAEFKANAYVDTHAELFIESSREQALSIARLAGKPVYCAESSELIPPSKRSASYVVAQARESRDRIKQLLVSALQSPAEVLSELPQRLRKYLFGIKQHNR